MTTWIGSPNFTAGRQGNRVSGVVIHWMAGRLAGADSVFQNRARNTSAHYGVEDATVHQYVKEEDTAYQAGNWQVNLQTIGIEHSAEPGRNASDATYESSAQLIANAAKRWGFSINQSTVRPHNSVVATQCPGTVDVNRLIKRANELSGVVSPATASFTYVGGVATVTVPTLNVRSAPNTGAPLAGSQTLSLGQTFEYTELVQGQSVSGVSTWVHSKRGNYVWAGGTNLGSLPATTPSVQPQHATGGRAEALRAANVRTEPNTAAAPGGSVQLQPGDTFDYSAKVHGQSVTQNGVTSNLWYHSIRGNYVWSGNCKDI